MARSPVDRRRLRRVAALIAAACLVPAALDGWQSYMQARLGGSARVPWGLMAFQAGEWIILGALTPIAYLLGTRFPLRPPWLRHHVAVHLGGALVLCVAWASAGIGLRAVLGMLPTDMPLSRHAASWMLTSLPWSVFMYFTVLGCVMAFAYFFEAKEREAQTARLTAQVAQARLGALRMQLHPHFLFNSLNAVQVLIRDRRNADANLVVDRLSDILRHVLSQGDAQEVPLAEEVEILRKYLAIEVVRFPDRLTVQWDITIAAAAGLVPSFVLQPLVENALRHGVAAMSQRGTVSIAARVENATLVLLVANDVPDDAVPAPNGGSGVGLANTRERLKTLYGDRASLTLSREAGRVSVTIRLPYRAADDVAATGEGAARA
ncbi:MAG TPA: histidine kinase [Gemmatimonadaceae bacterium]|nr:histidine kinase [Gemmatimonadaceae bacterium]